MKLDRKIIDEVMQFIDNEKESLQNRVFSLCDSVESVFQQLKNELEDERNESINIEITYSDTVNVTLTCISEFLKVVKLNNGILVNGRAPIIQQFDISEINRKIREYHFEEYEDIIKENIEEAILSLVATVVAIGSESVDKAVYVQKKGANYMLDVKRMELVYLTPFR